MEVEEKKNETFQMNFPIMTTEEFYFPYYFLFIVI